MQFQKKAHEILEQINFVIRGKETQTAEILLAFLSNGHILLEDIPGVGKTTLARAVYQELEWYKKLLFRYGKAFI